MSSTPANSRRASPSTDRESGHSPAMAAEIQALRSELDAERRKGRGEKEMEERGVRVHTLSDSQSQAPGNAQPLSTVTRWLMQGQGCQVGVHSLQEGDSELTREQKSERDRMIT
jgi:hypothetical protein